MTAGQRRWAVKHLKGRHYRAHRACRLLPSHAVAGYRLQERDHRALARSLQQGAHHTNRTLPCCQSCSRCNPKPLGDDPPLRWRADHPADFEIIAQIGTLTGGSARDVGTDQVGISLTRLRVLTGTGGCCPSRSSQTGRRPCTPRRAWLYCRHSKIMRPFSALQGLFPVAALRTPPVLTVV